MGGAYRRDPHRICWALVRWVDWCEPSWRQIRSGTTKNLLREGVEKRFLLRRNPEGRYRGSVRKGCGRIVQGRPDQGLLHYGFRTGTRLCRGVAEIDQRSVHGGHGSI